MKRKITVAKTDDDTVVPEEGPLVKSYTIYRTDSPYRWQLMTIYTRGDRVVSREVTENIPGIIKTRLMNAILNDLENRGKAVK